MPIFAWAYPVITKLFSLRYQARFCFPLHFFLFFNVRGVCKSDSFHHCCPLVHYHWQKNNNQRNLHPLHLYQASSRLHVNKL